MARATRSQPQLSQRATRAANGRSQPVDNGYDEDEDDEADAGDYEDGMDVDGDGDQHARKELDHKAGDLARLALFTESRRVALKRDEISKKGTCKPASPQKIPSYLFAHRSVPAGAGAEGAERRTSCARS